MRKFSLISFLTLVSFPAMAELLPCDVLKAQVDAKLQAKGVPVYTLEIVPMQDSEHATNSASAVTATKQTKGKEVGTCDGGTKRLIYTRGN